VKIAGSYGLSTDWILTGKGSMEPESGLVAEAGKVYNTTNLRDDIFMVRGSMSTPALSMALSATKKQP
jgi:hypothetical protein